MGRHVVGALERVREVVGAVGHRAVEPGGEVAPHVGRGVLVEGQRGRGVLHEDVGDAHAAARLSSGSSRSISAVTRWKPRGRSWRVIWRWIHTWRNLGTGHILAAGEPYVAPSGDGIPVIGGAWNRPSASGSAGGHRSRPGWTSREPGHDGPCRRVPRLGRRAAGAARHRAARRPRASTTACSPRPPRPTAGGVAVLAVGFDRLPYWAFHLLAAGGTLAASAAIYAWGGESLLRPAALPVGHRLRLLLLPAAGALWSTWRRSPPRSRRVIAVEDPGLHARRRLARHGRHAARDRPPDRRRADADGRAGRRA